MRARALSYALSLGCAGGDSESLRWWEGAIGAPDDGVVVVVDAVDDVDDERAAGGPVIMSAVAACLMPKQRTSGGGRLSHHKDSWHTAVSASCRLEVMDQCWQPVMNNVSLTIIRR